MNIFSHFTWSDRSKCLHHLKKPNLLNCLEFFLKSNVLSWIFQRKLIGSLSHHCASELRHRYFKLNETNEFRYRCAQNSCPKVMKERAKSHVNASSFRTAQFQFDILLPLSFTLYLPLPYLGESFLFQRILDINLRIGTSYYVKLAAWALINASGSICKSPKNPEKSYLWCINNTEAIKKYRNGQTISYVMTDWRDMRFFGIHQSCQPVMQMFKNKRF